MITVDFDNGTSKEIQTTRSESTVLKPNEIGYFVDCKRYRLTSSERGYLK